MNPLPELIWGGGAARISGEGAEGEAVLEGEAVADTAAAAALDMATGDRMAMVVVAGRPMAGT